MVITRAVSGFSGCTIQLRDAQPIARHGIFERMPSGGQRGRDLVALGEEVAFNLNKRLPLLAGRKLLEYTGTVGIGGLDFSKAAI